ncbi:MAG TPA: multidrug effflux MFS transporter, partial [Arenibaculum sp.]|nr:multidrug effflux MFS transporter [Arenibaculum sp.]
DLYLPSLPTLVTVFGTDIGTVQLTLSVFLVGFAVSQLVYGPLSDRFGRRPVLLGGITVFLLASIACMMAGTIEELIAARFFPAVGACCGPVLGRAIARDVYGRERSARVLAYMTMAMALAPAVGPIIGGWLTTALGWRANFALLALYGFAMLVSVAGLLAESNPHRDRTALRPGRLAANYAMLLQNRPYLACVLCVAFIYSGIFSFISGSSFVLIDRLSLTPTAYGMSFGAVVLGYMVGTFAAGRLTLRLGIDRMIRMGTVVALAGGVLGMVPALAGIVSLPAILGPMFVFMAGAGLALPNAMAGAVGPFPTMAGLASALLGFVQMLVASAVGILVGHLHDGTSLPMMAMIAAAALVAASAYRALAGREPQPA